MTRDLLVQPSFLGVVLTFWLFCRDVLNHSYFDKRKLYLAGLAASLKDLNKQRTDENEKYDMTIALFKGDDRKPILNIKPKFECGTFSVRIIPVVSLVFYFMWCLMSYLVFV